MKFPVDAPKKKVIRALENLGFSIVHDTKKTHDKNLLSVIEASQ